MHCNPLCPLLQWHKGFLCLPTANALPGRADSNQRVFFSEGSSLDPGMPVLTSAQAWTPSGPCTAAAIQAGGRLSHARDRPCLGQDGREGGL